MAMGFPEESASPVRTTRKHPSPLEDSDSSNDVPAPLVLNQVMADLLRLTEELGPTHIKVAETWNSLGLIRLHMQNNIEAAIKCHREALSIYRTNQDATNLATAVTLNDLGRCYERLHDCATALQTYEQAAELMQKDPTIRKNHTFLESVLRSMARLRRE